MKKLLVLILCLSSTMLFAQTLHYEIDNNGCEAMQTTVTGVLMIDNEEVYNGVGMHDAGGEFLEIGVFDQDGICRGTKLPTWRAKSNQWIYQLKLRGYAGCTYPTFMVYDHATETEFELVLDIEETIVWTANGKYGSTTNPYAINFTASTTTPEEITWNVGGDWPAGTVPPAGDDVIIPDNTIVTIPSGYVAIADEITLPANSTIIIEEGGQLFHNDNVAVTMELEVAGYQAKDNPAGYKLIAPSTYTTTTFSIPATAVTNLVPTPADDMDLYYFDGSQVGEEWRNFKLSTNGFTDLKLEKGYLYANVGGADLEFAGNTVPTAQREITLDFNAAAILGAWNLIGNPFTCNASVDKAFYVLEGTDLVSKDAGQLVLPMQGFFVKATATGEQVVLTPTTTTKAGASLNITVSQANAMVDNAIVSFNAGSGLEKFQLNPNHTKVYMPVEGRDYAVVSADNQGEMPVCFKAETNGTYSLDFSSKNTEFSYLHLIDNMTGNDVDLLATPSYSF